MKCLELPKHLKLSHDKMWLLRSKITTSSSLTHSIPSQVCSACLFGSNRCLLAQSSFFLLIMLSLDKPLFSLLHPCLSRQLVMKS